MSTHLTSRSKRTKPTAFLEPKVTVHVEEAAGPCVIIHTRAGLRGKYRFDLEKYAKKVSKRSDAVFDAATAVRMLENPAPASEALLDILALD